MKGRLSLVGVFAVALVATAARANDDRDRDDSRNPCTSIVPASMGGPVPRDDKVVLRWLGCSNYELSYRGQVLLFDAYYDRGPRNRPIGLLPDQVTRADAIFLGHGHFDHMSDAASIGVRLNIPIVGGPPTSDKLAEQGVPDKLNKRVTGQGGERFNFRGFHVDAVLGHHSVLAGPSLADFRTAITDEIGDPTPEEAAAEAKILARGTSSPDVITIGTIAFFVTFNNGFRLVWLDSAGPITDFEREYMARIRRTDVAIVAYQGHFVQETQIPPTFSLVQLFNPRYYLPAHHDEIAGIFFDMGIEPLFLTFREQMPRVKGVSPLYREPVCFNVETRQLVHSEH